MTDARRALNNRAVLADQRPELRAKLLSQGVAAVRHALHNYFARRALRTWCCEQLCAMFLNLPTVGEPLSNKTQGVHYRPPFASLWTPVNWITQSTRIGAMVIELLSMETVCSESVAEVW